MNKAKAKWNRKYSDPDYLFGEKENEFLARHATRLDGGRILSLGDGEGRNSVYLAQCGYDVVAVDLSETGLSKAQSLARKKDVSVTLIAGDLSQSLFVEASFDGACLFFMQVPRSERTEIFSHMDHALKPGALIILEVFGPHHLAVSDSGPGQAELFLSKDEVLAHLKGYEILHAIELERVLDEGKTHQGLSGVTQVIARKPMG